MFRQGQLAVHGLAILLGKNKAGISKRGKFFLHHAVHMDTYSSRRIGSSVLPSPYLPQKARFCRLACLKTALASYHVTESKVDTTDIFYGDDVVS